MSELLLVLTLLIPLEEETRCTLEVQVVDALGPLPGAMVHVFEKGREPIIMPTNEHGLTTFTGLNTITTYFAGAEFPGYLKAGQETSCPGADGNPVILTLIEPDATWAPPPGTRIKLIPLEVDG